MEKIITPEYVRVMAANNEKRRPDLVNREHKRIVEEGGGIYEPGLFGDLVLFDSPDTGSTLALPESKLTPEAVRARILESNKAFGITS